MLSGKPREKHYCWKPVFLLAELTALAWHSSAQKPLLAKSEPPHRELPSSPPSFPSSRCWAWQHLLLDRSWDKNPLAVWVHPTKQHIGGWRSDPTPSLAKVVPSGEKGGDWGGNRIRRKVATGWLDTELGKREMVLLLSLDR